VQPFADSRRVGDQERLAVRTGPRLAGSGDLGCPPDRPDVICRQRWSAFDVDFMPMDLLKRLVDHIRSGHFVPMRSGENHVR
jgi:hypothetical protein